MPEGSLALLENRFSSHMDDAYYNSENEGTASDVSSLPGEDEHVSQPAPSSPASSAPADASRPDITAPSRAKVQTVIPEKYRGTILQENMAGNSPKLIKYGEGLLRNFTKVPDQDISAIMNQGMNLQLEDISEPQVLLFHTHATESYEPYDSENYDIRNTWRSTDNTNNMIAVGNALEKQLKDAGIGVIHDKTQHDYPSYNGSYERSAKTIQSYLKKHPTIKVVIDVHRDAIQRDKNLVVKPVVEINGKKAAQLMIITGSDDGTMNIPKWKENLRFAASVQNAIEQDYPHLTRPIFFCYRKYNMDLTTGSLLFEVGSNGNTLEESVYSAELFGKSLARLLNESKPTK
ncbi:stage II sporulation protein P [Oscillospiraceae bacterium PP1C4]